MSGCVPVVRHWPTNGDSGSSAGFGRCASGPIGVAIRNIIADGQHGHAPGVPGHGSWHRTVESFLFPQVLKGYEGFDDHSAVRP
jgi:hypothetical protein